MSSSDKEQMIDGAVGDSSFNRLGSTLTLDESVTRVRLVSPARARTLAKLGVKSVRDMLNHYPRRYIDMSRIETIADASIGEMRTIIGTIHEIKLKRPKPRMNLVEIALTDASGILMITCFRQPWLMDTLAQGMRIVVSGKVEFNYGFKRLTNPFIEILDESFDASSGLIIPVHPASEKLSTAMIRRLMRNALDLVPGIFDPLPLAIRNRYRLMSRQNALSCIHFPHHMDEVTEARRRLVYEEVLLLELFLKSESLKRGQGKTATQHTIYGPSMVALKEALPFELTDEQFSAIKDIERAMKANKPANHMVLGDVGTGKTIVAAFGIAAAKDSGTQAIMMAPTEVLARQYALSLGDLFNQIGIRWAVLTGSTSASERAEIHENAQTAHVDVLFGTHALLEGDVVLKNCSLVIIDEQHRFGVNQRESLLAKAEAPDALYLTATPIPRSLALAIYGDLSLSYIKQRPTNSAGNKTKVLTKSQRGVSYDAALAALSRGRQVFVICPLVGEDFVEEKQAAQKQDIESEEDRYEYASVSIESDEDFFEANLKAAKTEAEFLQKKVFFEYKVDLLYGKMSGQEKQEVMDRFRKGETQVLVSTTVIEVGVDVPNASVIIIEDADRFGLSQLHQLRGRVGRGDEPGEVFLVSSSKSPVALDRLSAMEKTEDGFELAQYDLSLRREGDILGNRQHGASLLKLVNVVRDGSIIEAAHNDAADILDVDPMLSSDEYKPLAREMRIAFKDMQKVQGG